MIFNEHIINSSKSFDGHIYGPGEELPDLGSLVGESKGNASKRSYYGLVDDFDKLPTRAMYPKYKDLQTGSDATLICDEGLVYCYYESTTDTWYVAA